MSISNDDEPKQPLDIRHTAAIPGPQESEFLTVARPEGWEASPPQDSDATVVDDGTEGERSSDLVPKARDAARRGEPSGQVRRPGREPDGGDATEVDGPAEITPDQRAWRFFHDTFEVDYNPDSFFATLERTRLPVIVVVGTQAAGKSTLIRSWCGLGGGDRLAALAGEFARQTGAAQLPAALSVRRPPNGRRPLVTPCDVTGEPTYRDVVADVRSGHGGADALSHWRQKFASGVITNALDLPFYRHHRDAVPLREAAAGWTGTTQLIVAHFVELAEQPFVLLDVPGEAAGERRSVARDVLRRWLRRIVAGVVVVSPVDSLWHVPRGHGDLRIRYRQPNQAPWSKLHDYMPASDFAAEALQNTHQLNQAHVLAGDWEHVFGSLRKRRTGTVAPILCVLSKMDVLGSQRLEFQASDRADEFRLLAGHLAALDSAISQPERLKELMSRIFTAAEHTVDDLSTRPWHALRGLDGEERGYCLHELLPFVPTRCARFERAVDSDGKFILNSDGTFELVRQPAYDGVRLTLTWAHLQIRAYHELGG